MPTVAVCIVTYRRPGSLRELLESLGKLDIRGGISVRVVVADNHEAQEGREVVENIRARYPFQIGYSADTRRNISDGRNRAIEMALAGGAELIAFIDDDEVPGPQWLSELVRVQKMTSAEIVGGPVVPHHSADTPAWIVRGKFFEIPRHPTGSFVPMVFTGNVLFTRRLLEARWARFSRDFGSNGGEDTHFFMRARLAGYDLAWANEALVHEQVRGERATAAWILKRAFRVGNQYVACERALLPMMKWLPERLIKAGIRIVQGIVMLLPGMLAGRAGVVGAARKVAHGAGCMAGVIGVSYGEYGVAND